MQESSKLHLTNYQLAVLTEMGVSSWQLLGQQQTVEQKSMGLSSQNDNSQIEQPMKVAEQVVSKDTALARLAAMKTPIEKPITVPAKTIQKTDNVLLAVNNELPLLMHDVLLALDLEHVEQVLIDATQVPDYAEYPLAWKQAEQVHVEGKVLSTPSLPALQNAQSKKQLWQAIQSLIKQ